MKYKYLVSLSTFLFLLSCTQEKENTPPNLRSVLKQEVQSEGIHSALAHLEYAMEQGESVSSVCHALTHSIGHAAYDAHGLQALQEGNDLCGSGYFHGVIERHFQNTTDILETFTTLCSADDGRCFHGLGHGLMFATDNALPDALSYCGRLEKKAQKIQCAEGVFMENFSSNDEVHPSAYKNPLQPFYPCNEQEHPYKGVCAFYAARYYFTLHPDDADGIITWCTKRDTDSKDACFKGIGSAFAKYHITNLPFAAQTCDSVPLEMQHVCYQGIVSYIIVHFASPEKGAEWCSTLDGTLQKHCNQIVRESRPFYLDASLPK